MQNQSLKKALTDLRSELNRAEGVQGPERERLLELMRHLEQRLEGPRPDDASLAESDDASLVDHVRQSVEQFEPV